MENVGRGERLRAFSWDADVSSAMLIGSGERLGRGRLVRVSASGT